MNIFLLFSPAFVRRAACPPRRRSGQAERRRRESRRCSSAPYPIPHALCPTYKVIPTPVPRISYTQFLPYLRLDKSFGQQYCHVLHKA
jgi:hypothetical protein